MKIDRGSGKPIVAEQGTNTNTRSSLDTHNVSPAHLHAAHTRPGPSSDIPAFFSALTYSISCKSKAEEARMETASYASVLQRPSLCPIVLSLRDGIMS